MEALVAYFSATGVTRRVAENLAKALKVDTYEIKAKVPYTHEDLNWTDKKSRSSVEMADKAFRPELADKNANISDYDTIFLGFPIWWYVAPTIINTFLESYDFSGKTIVLFATSGGSGMGKTADELKKSVASNTIIKTGSILKGSQSQESLVDWIANLAL